MLNDGLAELCSSLRHPVYGIATLFWKEQVNAGNHVMFDIALQTFGLGTAFLTGPDIVVIRTMDGLLSTEVLHEIAERIDLPVLCDVGRCAECAVASIWADMNSHSFHRYIPF